MKQRRLNMKTKTSNGHLSTLRQIDVDFLFLDLKTCTRCVGTDKNLEQALASVEQVLRMAGAELSVNKIFIDSTEKARAHHFITSPTIRVNGRDIALETRESKCDSCTDLCGCAEGTDCRVWLYRGEEYTEAPVAMIVEAILQEVFGAPQPAAATALAYEVVPKNLERFFDGVSERTAPTVSTCCSPAKQQTCCEPSEKASCCGAAAEQQSCGCQ
jgi:hypothetical protein